MAKAYKPGRAVTSDKIRADIERMFNEKNKDKYRTRASSWKRMFKRRLPESRSWVRGYIGEGVGTGGTSGMQIFWALAISNEADTAIESIYFCQNADEECKRLGVNEVMFS